MLAEREWINPEAKSRPEKMFGTANASLARDYKRNY
jgi:hypothetical protein